MKQRNLSRLEHLGTFKDFSDGTLKSIYNSKRGIIEATLITNKPDIDVYCVPTHHYCNLGCKMCHLTAEGRKKKMKTIQSKDLAEAIFRTAYKRCEVVTTKADRKRTTNRKCLISYMGVGEPLLNVKLVEDLFLEEANLKNTCNYDKISYALATMMPNHSLKKLAEIVQRTTMPMKVHFSLHSPFSDERLRLLPKTKVGVEEALDLLVGYRENVQKSMAENFLDFHETNNPIEIHYTLIEKLNDSDMHLKKLTRLLKKYMIPFKLLSFNPISEMKRSKKEDEWIKELRNHIPGLSIVKYTPPGREIGSSCGEFTKHYYLSELETEEEKQEFLEWKKKHQIFE